MPGIASRNRSRHSGNIWPGFVDALATLLMVIIFLLMVFVLAQFFLSEALSGRDQAVTRLQEQVAELGNLLALERKASADLGQNVKSLSEELQASIRQREDLSLSVGELSRRSQAAEDRSDQLNRQLAEAFQAAEADKEKVRLHLTQLAALSADLEALRALRDEMEKDIAAQIEKTAKAEQGIIEERKLSESARAQVALLNRQMAELRSQLAALEEALDAAEREATEKNVQIEALGQRLNAALAGKVQQLARYRSEFFGRLREVLGDSPDLHIVGDRFVLQSELLFETGSADLGDGGKLQMRRLATTLKEISAKIPEDVDWVLRIDGHTDRVPISNWRYHDNWELSAGRAISVVRQLIANGIPATRLVAAGFGEQHPIAESRDPESLKRNRRIELKLTQR